MTNDKQLILAWVPPPQDDILAGFTAAYAQRPDVATLTIILKLLTQRGTEALFTTTQKRVTNMLHEITVRFFNDLDNIETGKTFPQLTDAIVALVADSHPDDAEHLQATAGLRKSLHTVYGSELGTDFIITVLKAMTSLNPEDQHNTHWNLLRQCLENWYANHADKKMTDTIEQLTQATKEIVIKDETGQVKRDADGEPLKEVVSVYTPHEVTQIQLALTLRRALVEKHAAQVITTRTLGMAILALRESEDEGAFTRIVDAINQRCAGQPMREMVITIVNVVRQQFSDKDVTLPAIEAFRSHLFQLSAKVTRQWNSLNRAKQTGRVPRDVRPLSLLLVDELTEPKDAPAMLPVRNCIERWFRELTEKQQSQQFVPDDLRLIKSVLKTSKQMELRERQLGMALLLHGFFQAHESASTDVLLLASLAEKVVRRIGDGDELLSGILSNCYGEVCSSYRYPISGILREAVFVNRAGAILGWFQQVADYVAERNKRRPGNVLPTREKGRAKLFSFVDLFRGRRVVRIGLLYHLWKHEDHLYRESVSTPAPVSPEIGKTLGNPISHKVLRRQRASKRRLVTALGRGVIGKRGARRMKNWLLPPKERVEALKFLDVLIYPELDWDDELRSAARLARHPYGVNRTKRGVAAVRPTQFRIQRGRYGQRLVDLSTEQKIKLREELREQHRYAAQFETFGQALNHFLDGAPPAPPFISSITFTEVEIAQLSPEAKLDVLESQESLKVQFDRALDWFHDFKPRRGDRNTLYSDEKLFDVETLATWELEWSAAALTNSKPQPIWFHRRMKIDFKPRSFALLYHLQQSDKGKRYRFTFVCELVGATADERKLLLEKERTDDKHDIVNFQVNHPDRQVTPPRESTLQFFATQMGANHQESILHEFMDWRRQIPETSTHLISTASIISRQRTSKRTDWYAHLPVPLPVPSTTLKIDACIGFHEHDGMFYYVVIDLQGTILALGEVILPSFVQVKGNDGMTSDNFAFETAVQMIWRSITSRHADRLRDNPVRYTAYIGIEDTGWKHDLVGVEAGKNRENVSLPRKRIVEIVGYKALRYGLPLPQSIKGIAPSRDCGQCNARMDVSGVEWRVVTHCFHCHTLGIRHSLVKQPSDSGEVSLKCTACKRVWQRKEPQFKCQHCRYTQHASYNTPLVTVHRTIDKLVGRQDEFMVE